MKNRRGFTLIELLLTIGITVIISVIFAGAFRSGFGTWMTGVLSLKSVKEGIFSPEVVLNKLSNAQEIVKISLAGDPQGYIQFRKDSYTFTIFYNKPGTPVYVANSFPADTILFYSQQGALRSDIEVLMSQVKNFKVIAYNADPNPIASVHQVTPNNIISGSNLDEINSVRFAIEKSGVGARVYTINHLTSLLKAVWANKVINSGIKMGYFLNLAIQPQEYPFLPTSGWAGISGPASIQYGADFAGGDLFYLQPQVWNVKIQNTGLYFSNIRNAINAANANDTILVSGGTGVIYSENLDLTGKTGVRILGGFNPFTWERDIDLYPTTIIGVNNGTNETIKLTTGNWLDGLIIDGHFMTNAVYADTATDIVIRHCTLQNTNQDVVYLKSAANVRFENNKVTTDLIDSAVAIPPPRYALHLVNAAINAAENVIVRNYFNTVNESISKLVGLKNVKALIASNIFYNAFYSLEMETSELRIQNNTFYNENDGTRANVAILENTGPNTLHIYSNYFEWHTTAIHALHTGNILSIAYNRYRNFSSTFKFIAAIPALDIDNLDIGVSPMFALSPPIEPNHFLLQVGSPLADAVNGSGLPFDNVYTGGKPAWGNAKGDVGAYGGLWAGRVGPGVVHRPSIGNVQSALTNYTDSGNNILPGDFIQIPSGNMTIAGNVDLRYSVNLTGFTGENSILKVTGPLSLKGNNTIRDIQFQTANPIKYNPTSPASAPPTGFDQSHITNCTLAKCNPGILASSLHANWRLEVTNCSLIGSGVETGIDNNFYSGLTARNLIFHNCATPISSPGIASISYSLFWPNAAPFGAGGNVSQSPQFWISKNRGDNLIPTSPGVNIDNHREAGANEIAFQQADVVFPEFTDRIKRKYKTITIGFFGDGSPSSYSSGYTVIEVGALLKQNGFERCSTVSQQVVVTGNTTTLRTESLTLPTNIIANTVQFRFAIKSYTYNSAPVINQIRIDW